MHVTAQRTQATHVRGVGDELTEEDVLVAVERVDQDVHQARHLRLELILFGALARLDTGAGDTEGDAARQAAVACGATRVRRRSRGRRCQHSTLLPRGARGAPIRAQQRRRERQGLADRPQGEGTPRVAGSTHPADASAATPAVAALPFAAGSAATAPVTGAARQRRLVGGRQFHGTLGPPQATAAATIAREPRPHLPTGTWRAGTRPPPRGSDAAPCRRAAAPRPEETPKVSGKRDVA